MFASKSAFYFFLVQVVAMQLVFSNESSSQELVEVKLALVIQDAAPEQIFQKLEELTEFKFGYNRHELPKKIKLSIIKTETNLRDVLLDVAERANLKFKRVGRHILVLKNATDDEEKIETVPDKTITGRVTDQDSGEPLRGATVAIKEYPSVGAVVDDSGNFRIVAPDDARTLVISFVGYATREINMGTRTRFEISMQADAQSLDNVVVTGYKQQNTQVIQAKLDALQIADFLSQDNIGRLPDFAAADAARRIPGVNAVFEEDEATKIAIRGLDPIYTNSSIDGIFIPGAEVRSRVVNFESIPSSAISQIEVYKSRTANLDGNGIAGNFNLKTRSAFDGDFGLGRLTVGKYTFDDVARSESFRNDASSNGPSIQSDLTIARRLGAAKKIGVVFSGSYNRKDRDQFTFPKNNVVPFGGDPALPVPNRIYGAVYDNVVNRYGGLAKLEYKPNDRSYFSIMGNYFGKEDDEIRYENRILGLAIDPASITTSGGRFTEAQNRAVLDNFFYDRKLTNILLTSEQKLGESGKLTTKASMAWTESTIGSYWGEFRTAVSTELSGSYTMDRENFNVMFDNPSFFMDPLNYVGTGSPGGRKTLDKAESKLIDITYSNKMDSRENGFAYQFGLQSRNLLNNRTRTDMRIAYTGDPISWGDFALPAYYNSEYMNVGLITYDNVAFQNHIAANSNTDAWDDQAIGYENNRALIPNYGDQFEIDETVHAFHAMGRLKGENFTLNGGFRYEITRTDFQRPLNENGSYNGNFLEQSNNYGNFLPSVGLTYNINTKSRVKAAFYRAIGRGDFVQIAPAASLDNQNMTVREGNPDLKPREADNFDISFETYLDNKSTLISFGAFRKTIRNEIADLSFFRNDGYEVTTTTNIGRVGFTGLEFNVIKSDFKNWFPGFLGNFGISTNYTFISGERDVNGLILGETTAAPRNLFNAQLFYQATKFDARLAYSWVDDSLLTLRDDNAGDGFDTNVYWIAAGQLDFTANYYFLDNYTFFVEAKNFTNNGRGFYNRSYLNTANDYGYSIWAGITVKF